MFPALDATLRRRRALRLERASPASRAPVVIPFSTVVKRQISDWPAGQR